MPTFKSFFILEFNRLFRSWRYLVVFLVFLLLSFYLVNVGIQQYEDMHNRKEQFRNLESKKVEQIANYLQYGLYGFRLYFMPSSMSALFYNSSHFTELTCRIDSGEKLNIYSLFKGKKVFEEKPGKSMDFSGIILILGSFMALFYGFDSFRHQEYIKFLSSLYGHRQTFFFIWLSRVVLLCVFFTAATLLAVVWLTIRNVEIKYGGLADFLVFFLVILMMQVFFFTLGTLASSIRSRLFAGLFIIIAWICSVYIIPAGLNKIVEAKAEKMPPYYQVELAKLSTLMDFQTKQEKEYNKVNNQYSKLYALYNKIAKKNETEKKKIRTSEDFWKLMDAEKKKKENLQTGLEILREIESLKEEKKREKLSFQTLRGEVSRILDRLKKQKEVKKEVQEEFEKVDSQYQVIQSLNDQIEKKEVETSEDFWDWIDYKNNQKANIQGELEILEEIIKRRTENLPFEELRKFTAKKLNELYTTLNELRRKEAKNFLKHEFKDIQAFEKKLLDDMESNINIYHWLFSLYPTAFYLSTGNEVSGRGYAGIIEFYNYAKTIKEEFLEFYVPHRHFGKKSYKIVNFIEEVKETKEGKKEANIFYAKSALPRLYGLGFLFSSVWIAVVFILSYGFYKRRALFLLPKRKIIGLNELNIDLSPGCSHVVVSPVRGKELNGHLYNVLSGKNKDRGFTGSVTYNAQPDNQKTKKYDVQLDYRKLKESGFKFVYLCQPEEIPPDIKVGMLVSFFRRTLKLGKDQLTEISPNKFKIDLENFKRMYINEVPIEILGLILMEIARLRKSKVYLIYSFTDRMASDYRHEIIEQLEKLKKEQEGVSILYITNELSLAQRIGDYISVLKKESAY